MLDWETELFEDKIVSTKLELGYTESEGKLLSEGTPPLVVALGIVEEVEIISVVTLYLSETVEPLPPSKMAVGMEVLVPDGKVETVEEETLADVELVPNIPPEVEFEVSIVVVILSAEELGSTIYDVEKVSSVEEATVEESSFEVEAV